MHAEIAGAGFAGLTAAIALRRRGWSVRVHEKEAALAPSAPGSSSGRMGCACYTRSAHMMPLLPARIRLQRMRRGEMAPASLLRK